MKWPVKASKKLSTPLPPTPPPPFPQQAPTTEAGWIFCVVFLVNWDAPEDLRTLWLVTVMLLFAKWAEKRGGLNE